MTLILKEEIKGGLGVMVEICNPRDMGGGSKRIMYEASPE
jgi:hypothetical protein